MLLMRKAAAELAGTFVLVFAGCGAIMVAERFPGSVPPGGVPVAFGLAVAAMVYALGHISGAHFNPAVTFAFALTRQFPKREVLAYWFAQFCGAILAVGILKGLLPPGSAHGATVPQVSSLQALGWEFILTFCLMFVIIAVATDTRAIGTMAGAAIGATVTLAALIGGPVSGASLNPARSLAPALFQGEPGRLWVYFVGPMAGASLAAFAYQWIRCETSDQPGGPKGCC